MKFSKINLDFNFALLIPYLVWILLIFIYIFNSNLIKAGELDGLIKYGNDADNDY